MQRAPSAGFDVEETLYKSDPLTSKESVVSKLILSRFLDRLKYLHPSLKYFWVIGISRNGLIHFHILLDVPYLSLGWVRKKWFRLSGCHQVQVNPFKPSDIYYLLKKNAAEFPSAFDVNEFSIQDSMRLRNFRRLGHSQGLILGRKSLSTNWKITNIPSGKFVQQPLLDVLIP